MPLTTSPTHARRMIEAQLQLLWASPNSLQHVAPIMLWGPPGVGKSQIVKELCAQLGIQFIDVRLSQLEPVDIRGIPVPAGDRVKWVVSTMWPSEMQSRGIVLFDELPAADRALQVAAYELLLDRRLGDLYQLPAGWLVMGAGNRREDNAVSFPLSSALSNRLLHLEIAADIESWSAYAISKGFPSELVAFLRFKPEYLLANDDHNQRGWPSPRSWERVAFLLKSELYLDEYSQQLMITGLIGESACTELLAFLQASKLRFDVPAMLRGDVPVDIPETVDQQLTFCTSLAQILWKGESHLEQRRLSVFFEISLKLTSDLATLLLMDALRVEDDTDANSRAERMFAHPGFEDWLKLHGVPMDQITPDSGLELPEGLYATASSKRASVNKTHRHGKRTK